MIERFSTGSSGLDRILFGGLLRGSAYIVQGPPGAGKTILANQFCFSHIRSGGRALYMSLLAENHDRMLAYMEPMAFYDPSVVPDSLQYVSGYGTLEREGLPGLLKLMHHEIKRHRATAVVMDGVFVAQSNASESEFRKFVHELQGVAHFANATLMMLTHQSRPEDSPEHTMVDGWIELRDELKAFQAYRTVQVRKHRGSQILRGKHSFRITDAGVAVFPRIESTLRESPPAASTVQRLSTGVEELDRMSGGGWPAASATLVLGPTGAGKTTAGLHFVSGATPEEPALMLSFGETPERLEAKAQSVGVDLRKLRETGALEVLWRPPSENLVDELAWDLVDRARAGKVRRVFVDGLVALRGNLIHRERLSYVLNALNAHLRSLGAAAIYTSEIREMHSPDLMPTDEVSLMVDNVLLLTYLRREGALRRTFSIVKLRDGDFDPRAREFHLTRGGIVFGSDPQLGEPQTEAG